MPDNPQFEPDPVIRCRDYRIGAIGAGFIMADIHLASYKEAGFPVVAIASRTESARRGRRQALGHPEDPRQIRRR